MQHFFLLNHYFLEKIVASKKLFADFADVVVLRTSIYLRRHLQPLMLLKLPTFAVRRWNIHLIFQTKNWDLLIAPSFAGNTSVAYKPTAADSHILAPVNFVAFLPLEEEATVVMGASAKAESSFLAAQLRAAEDYSLLKEAYCSV